MGLLMMNGFNVLRSILDLRVYRIIPTFGVIYVEAHEPS